MFLCFLFLCRYHPQDLILHGDIGYGAEEQFENEAKMAVRLANFISAFLQVSVIPMTIFPLTVDSSVAHRCKDLQSCFMSLFFFRYQIQKKCFQASELLTNLSLKTKCLAKPLPLSWETLKYGLLVLIGNARNLPIALYLLLLLTKNS